MRVGISGSRSCALDRCGQNVRFDKAFLMGTLIIRLVEHLRLRARAGRQEGLRHVIVIEEAHRLLRAGREGRASAHAVELFASMLAEIRAYGEGLVIAEQIPAKLVPD